MSIQLIQFNQFNSIRYGYNLFIFYICIELINLYQLIIYELNQFISIELINNVLFNKIFIVNELNLLNLIHLKSIQLNQSSSRLIQLSLCIIYIISSLNRQFDSKYLNCNNKSIERNWNESNKTPFS